MREITDKIKEELLGLNRKATPSERRRFLTKKQIERIFLMMLNVRCEHIVCGMYKHAIFTSVGYDSGGAENASERHQSDIERYKEELKLIEETVKKVLEKEEKRTNNRK